MRDEGETNSTAKSIHALRSHQKAMHQLSSSRVISALHRAISDPQSIAAHKYIIAAIGLRSRRGLSPAGNLELKKHLGFLSFMKFRNSLKIDVKIKKSPCLDPGSLIWAQHQTQNSKLSPYTLNQAHQVFAINTEYCACLLHEWFVTWLSIQYAMYYITPQFPVYKTWLLINERTVTHISKIKWHKN